MGQDRNKQRDSKRDPLGSLWARTGSNQRGDLSSVFHIHDGLRLITIFHLVLIWCLKSKDILQSSTMTVTWQTWCNGMCIIAVVFNFYRQKQSKPIIFSFWTLMLPRLKPVAYTLVSQASRESTSFLMPM